MSATELLRTIGMFEGLPDEDLDALARELGEKTFRAGEIIFHQGDTGHAMYIVAKGDVNIFLPGEDSRRISLKDLSAGEYFGELTLFDDKPRSASALATTDVTLLELQRESLTKYLERRPRSAMAILRTISAHLRAADALLSQRAAKNVDEEFDKNVTWSDRLADNVAELNGSWAFILFLLALSGVWALVNKFLGKHAFDEYPFQAYNLFLALLVGLQGPLIVMSQNREGLKDRARAETDYKVNLKNEVNIETIVRELGEFRAEMNTRLDAVEKRVGVEKRPPTGSDRPVGN